MSDVPALEELARTLDLESLGHIARRMIAAKKAVPFDAFQYSEAERVYLDAFGEAGDGPERVLQLVALATGGAETDWRSLSVTAIAAENASVHEYVAALEARIAATESDVAIVDQEARSPRSELERMQARAEWAEQSAHTRGKRLEELRAVLGWLESVLRPGADPVEVYLAGLRQPGQPAMAFQVEVAPATGEGSFSVNAPTLEDALHAARSLTPERPADAD